jgi:deoxyribose-phosphate aldolase
LRETAGQGWLEAPLFQIGASSLLSDLLMRRRRQLTGACSGPDFTLG